MTKPRRRAIALVILALAIAGIAVFLIARRTAPLSPTVLIPVTWTTQRESPMHVLHIGKQIACDTCHGDSSTVPTSTACAHCHTGETTTSHHGGAGAATTCLTCHAFGLQAPATCAGCHAKDTRTGSAPKLEHHASAGLPCGSCHSVHAQKTERVVLADCTRCHAERASHGRFSTASSAHSGPTLPTDRDAAMAIDGDASALAFVRSESLPAHANLPADPLAATPGQVCSTCHAPHSGKEEARPRCATCHVERPGAPVLSGTPAVVPRGHDVASHASCTTCHAPHDARKSAVVACESCHEDHRGVAVVAGHNTCRGCHAPHAPTEAKTSCTTCHAQVAVLAGSKVAAHADCTSCHDPHKPSAAPSDACVKCHASTKPSHPPTKTAHGTQTCIGCHTPHGKNKVEPPLAVTCTSCHTKLGGDHEAHDKKVACTQCHKPHEFELAGLGPKLCAGCHAAKATAVATRPGHASCDGCHGTAHTPIPKPGCAGCHAVEAKTAPAGHAACTSCHDAHSGSLGNHAVCTTCHTDKANALHANATPAGCASCHTPHGPKGVTTPPACTTCHAPPTLKGLHAVGGHATCNGCHQAHGPPRFDRATCTGTCHTDKKNHQPEAKVCKGCHIFHD